MAPPPCWKRGRRVFLDPAEDVLGPVGLVAQADVADQVDELAEALFVEARVSVVLGDNTFERWVVPLDGEHGLVDGLADGGVA